TLRAHRCTYNQCVRAAGGKIREVGSAAGATPEQFTAALGERTAAVLFYDMYSLAGGLALSTIVKLVRDHPLSRARRIPILVDAAAELPPRENLTRYLRQGADLVIFSGGKELRGPQGTGLVLGRRELIAGCLANGCPKDAIGRPLKVTKEEIAALVAAVDRYLELDLDAQWRNWQGQVNWLVEQLNRCTHVHAEAFIMPPTSTCRPLVPNALIRWDEKALGKTISQVAAALREGDPAIYLRREGSGLAFNPHVLQPGQEETVVRRLKEVLAGA
ncbi:MAG: aminotransferase class V-fold PLP-dependent enzyme, partial [Phycisphaerae bacterium]